MSIAILAGGVDFLLIGIVMLFKKNAQGSAHPLSRISGQNLLSDVRSHELNRVTKLVSFDEITKQKNTEI